LSLVASYLCFIIPQPLLSVHSQRLCVRQPTQCPGLFKMLVLKSLIPYVVQTAFYCALLLLPVVLTIHYGTGLYVLALIGVGCCYNSVWDRFGREIDITGQAVVITGCDSGLSLSLSPPSLSHSHSHTLSLSQYKKLKKKNKNKKTKKKKKKKKKKK
jgi:hypothetical protein